jgi:hypothetical protein
VSLNKGKFARLNGVVREKDKDDLGICPLLGKKKKSMLYKWISRLSLIENSR